MSDAFPPHRSQAELRPAVSARHRALYSEAQIERMDTRAPITPGVRFGLFPEIGCTEPTRAFASAAELAGALQRRRGGRPIQLQDQRLVCGRCEADVVAVYTLDEGGYRDAFLGFAYLAGAGWRALQAELYAAERNPAARAEAA
jgi:hypothetical protein